MTAGLVVADEVHDSARVLDVMTGDLDSVSQRVLEVTELSYPVASSIIREIVMAGGKRLRPLLVLLAGRAYAYREHFEPLVTAAAGVELLHIASLVHDDTIDRAAIRRGKPTLNSVMSVGGTILVGDFLFAQSAMLAARTGDVRVVGVFASTLGELCDGQLLELFDSHKLDQGIETYIRRIYGKTGSLFAGAAEMGSVLAKAPESHVQELRQFASEVGLAFQIVDDIKDLTVDSDDLGKPSGNDLRQGTVTLPTLLFSEGTMESSDDRRLLTHVLTDDDVDDAEVYTLIARIRASGAVDGALKVALDYRDRGLARLECVPDGDARELLRAWAHLAVGSPS
jgi:geranylgeranyl pyrophosphate synthase